MFIHQDTGQIWTCYASVKRSVSCVFSLCLKIGYDLSNCQCPCSWWHCLVTPKTGTKEVKTEDQTGVNTEARSQEPRTTDRNTLVSMRSIAPQIGWSITFLPISENLKNQPGGSASQEPETSFPPVIMLQSRLWCWQFATSTAAHRTFQFQLAHLLVPPLSQSKCKNVLQWSVSLMIRPLQRCGPWLVLNYAHSWCGWDLKLPDRTWKHFPEALIAVACLISNSELDGPMICPRTGNLIGHRSYH